MDPNEILRQGSELVKVGLTAGAAVPFTAIVKKMLGPAADEIAERVRDEIRVYRYGRQLSLLRKAERLAHEAGFTPKAVPTKLLFALLEGGSLEENEDLHDKWAALLANAASPKMAGWVRPSFGDTLKLMTPEVAHLLDAVYAQVSEQHSAILPADDSGLDYDDGEVAGGTVSPALKQRSMTRVDLGTYNKLFELFGRTGGTLSPPGSFVTSSSTPREIEQEEADWQSFAVIMDELTRFQMWNIRTSANSGDHFYLSSYAAQFLMACHPPEPGVDEGQSV
jgi:Abortive infection alpha